MLMETAQQTEPALTLVTQLSNSQRKRVASKHYWRRARVQRQTSCLWTFVLRSQPNKRFSENPLEDE